MPHDHRWQFVSFGGLYSPGQADFICDCGDMKRVETHHI